MAPDFAVSRGLRGETTDLATKNAPVVERLEQLMQRCLDRGRSTPGEPQLNDVELSLAVNERDGK